MTGSIARQIILVAIILALGYFYITEKAIQTNTVTVREVVTVIDTVETVKIEERWKTSTQIVRDTLYIIKPDTVLISTPGADEILEWKEWIVRMLYQPPRLEFTTSSSNDSTYRHYVYEEIPWGFLVEPTKDGLLNLQLLPPPDPPLFSYDYGLGVGYELGSGPAVYGLGYLTYRKWRLDLIATIHLEGLRGSLILSR